MCIRIGFCVCVPTVTFERMREKVELKRKRENSNRTMGQKACSQTVCVVRHHRHWVESKPKRTEIYWKFALVSKKWQNQKWNWTVFFDWGTAQRQNVNDWPNLLLWCGWRCDGKIGNLNEKPNKSI